MLHIIQTCVFKGLSCYLINEETSSAVLPLFCHLFCYLDKKNGRCYSAFCSAPWSPDTGIYSSTWHLWNSDVSLKDETKPSTLDIFMITTPCWRSFWNPSSINPNPPPEADVLLSFCLSYPLLPQGGSSFWEAAQSIEQIFLQGKSWGSNCFVQFFCWEKYDY